MTDAPAAFGGEVPSLQSWSFGVDDLGRVSLPTLSLVNSGTYWPGFRETHDVLLARIPGCEGTSVAVSSHLLQIADPRPVAEPVARFLRRHPLAG